MQAIEAVHTVCRAVRAAGGTALVVGGAVRDRLSGAAVSKDFDVEVFSLGEAALVEVLGRHFDLDLVGQSFAVVKLRGVTNSEELIEGVVALVVEHLRPVMRHEARAGRPPVRRLAQRVRLDRLVRVALADQQGRPPLVVDEFPAGEWLLAEAAAEHITDRGPTPLVMGSHLIALGARPGPEFGPILAACFEAQLDGAFTTEADGVDYVRRVLG